MFGANTRKVFKELNSIGNSAIVRWPLTSLIQLDKSLISYINLEELGEEQFNEFGIYFLSEFLALIDIYDNGEITKEGNVIHLKDHNSSQVYKTSDVDIMQMFDLPSTILEKLNAAPVEAEIKISAENMEHIKKVAGLLKLKSFIVDFYKENKSANLVSCDLSENGQYMNESIIPISPASISEVNDSAKVVFDINNIIKIPSTNFNVKIIKNAQTGNYISLWEAEDMPYSIIASIQKAL